MGDFGGLIAAQAIQAGASASNAYSQTEALRGQQQYATTMTGVNSRWMDLQKADILKRGDVNASRYRLQGEMNASALKARAAASGVDANTGSAAQAQSDQRLLAEVNQLDAKNNAYMRALGISANQSAMASADRMRRLSTRTHIRNTLLQTGMRVGSDALRMKYYADRYGGLGGKTRDEIGSPYGIGANEEDE